MTRLILNCESPTSALNSLTDILGVTAATLIDRMQSTEIGADDLTDDVEQTLVAQFLADTYIPKFLVLWFHGTRLHRNHTLMTEGLLPAHRMEPRLRYCLQSLSEGIERRGCSRFASSKTWKPSHEGPFAMLCRTAVAVPSGVNGSYIFRPELVDDIAGELLGENFRALTDRFAQQSNPSIIHFLGSPTAVVLQRALRYVYETLIEGRDDIESATSSNACFDGGGIPVPPERILKIEILSQAV
ncbi:MAG: hypothetical protein PHX60_14970 [Giesbergeria sp.]|uniref:hypothetical protein n=1 Tax=Giesbergeria sp. TaxID=2818473 RepID=UPI0026093CB3|nr:hypothetical protein [Giesbergeria sp.]MDD2610955.1 hypothetical protein [Giesbergeria sp.]